MSAPEQHVSILQSEMRRLEEFLGTLSPEDWQRSSRCDQWTVADVVAHLTAMDQDCAARIGRALHSILKFFQIDNAGMLRMTSSARYFKEGVGARRPN